MTLQLNQARPSRTVSIPSLRSVSLLLSSLAVLFVIGITRGSNSDAMIPRGANTAVLSAAARNSNSNINSGLSATKHVFCFGDSLTAGTSPPTYNLFPYAKDLEQELNGNVLADVDTDTDSATKAFDVTWKGFPGWTSSMLLTDAGFQGFLNQGVDNRRQELKLGGSPLRPGRDPAPFDLVIVLSGTNDLAHSTDSQEIFEPIRKIHEAALEKGCSTIALGIPTSGWQAKHEPARALAGAVNEKLRSWIDTNANANAKTTFVPFPIQDFDRSSGLWSPDGLHFSPSGYELVGKSLAPIVAEILGQSE